MGANREKLIESLERLPLVEAQRAILGLKEPLRTRSGSSSHEDAKIKAALYAEAQKLEGPGLSGHEDEAWLARSILILLAKDDKYLEMVDSAFQNIQFQTLIDVPKPSREFSNGRGEVHGISPRQGFFYTSSLIIGILLKTYIEKGSSTEEGKVTISKYSSDIGLFKKIGLKLHQ
jgi:hypothetical protein